MATFTPEQIRNAQRVISVGRRKGAPWKVQLAALETILTESNARNVNHGDRDSLGLFQQRPSMGWGSRSQVTNPEYAAGTFFDRAIPIQNQYRRAGALAQAVQRSAFPDRYHQNKQTAISLFRQAGGRAAGGGATPITPASGAASRPPQGVLSTSTINLIFGDNPEVKNLLLNRNARDAAAAHASAAARPSVSRGTPTPARAGKGQPKDIVDLGKLAQRFGLHVGENPHFGGVQPVHAKNSWHYQGRAIDVSGDPAKMRQFANYVYKNYGSSLKELFWQGKGGVNVKNGQRVRQGFVSGHTDHVHLAF